MSRRPLLLPSALLLFACIALLPACKKKTPDSGGGPGGDAPANVSSEHVLFVHLKMKDVLDSQLFAEVKKAFAKDTDLWDKVEQEVAKELGGVKPTDIESVTVCITEVPERDMPKLVLILTANKPINKAGIPKLAGKKADARGFYPANQALAHFPDDKTLVLIHPDLAQKYLDGYAKDRSGWPMSADLQKAAAGHTLFAVADVSKLPTQMLPREAQQFSALLAARRVTLVADLKDKEISASVRATFPDAAAAEKAKGKVQELVGMASKAVDEFASKGTSDLPALKPAVTEAQRTLKGLKVELSGSDLIVAGSYKVTFDIGAAMAEAAKKVQQAAARMSASNNFKQIGLALHNMHDNIGKVPVHGVGPKGQPLTKATDKPLLSWRVAILPYIEQDNLYRQFKLDEPWDSEHNKKLIEKMPKIFEPVGKPTKPGYTHTQMVVGPNALQPPVARIPATFPDGTSNTIAVIEAAEPVIWTKPDDVMLPGKELPKDLRKKFGGISPGGFNALFWDGSVRFIRDTVSDRALGALLSPAGGEVIGDDW
jgi:prepilin-type processing-associated H-X9-DG protein